MIPDPIGALIAGLVRANLAAAVAVYAVAWLRRPARQVFGARAAYRLWIAPVLAAVATLIPPASAPAPLMAPVTAYATAVADGVQISVAAAPRLPWVLFGFWMAGVVAAAALLLWRQASFMAAIARREAGPAVVGALRPRIVTPADFETRFDPEEREVILAHEGAHLAGGDARINALAAALQCLAWFNPLVHLGVHLMRLDQELACDAAVLSRFPKARRLYAEVLLKTQLAAQPLPFGCHWPAADEHPLKERIVMLKSPLPAPARRWAGAACVSALCAAAAAAAWAAQPGQPKLAPVLAKAVAPTEMPVAPRLPAAAGPAKPRIVLAAVPRVARSAVPVEVAARTEPASPAGPTRAADRPVLPDWIAKPDATDIARFYPPGAEAANQEGRATIACRVDSDGRLTGCQTVAEAPDGAGFGAAALALAERFQMKPVDREGRATAGQAVRIPMKFALPGAAAK